MEERIISYVSAQGGRVQRVSELGLARQMAEKVGCDSVRALNATLERLAREGRITRDIRAGRTHEIALVDPCQREAGGDEPTTPSRGAKAESSVDEELLHPRSFARGCLLLLLSEREGHGYDLYVRLKPFALPGRDARWVYRDLRWLEAAELAAPSWDMSETGPARRVYRLTPAGHRALRRWTIVQRRRFRVLERHLSLPS